MNFPSSYYIYKTFDTLVAEVCLKIHLSQYSGMFRYSRTKFRLLTNVQLLLSIRNYLCEKYPSVLKQLNMNEDSRKISNILQESLKESDGFEWYPFKVS